MEKRGIRTDRGNINREIEITNQKLRQLKARIVKLQKWLKEETANTETPTLADYIQSILSRQAPYGRSHISQSIYNIKDAANMLNFLTANKITDTASLDNHFKNMIGRQMDIRDELKPIDRRLKTLEEHIRQAGNYQEYKAIYKKYTEQKPKTQESYRETHHREIALFEAAKHYLDSAMNGKTGIPIKSWKTEHAKLTADKNILNEKYTALKAEVKEAEQIRRSIHSIIRAEQRSQQPHPRKAQGIDW